MALNETGELLNQPKCVIYEARDNRRRVEYVRGMARRAADYWKPIDAQNFVTWQKFYVKTKLLLCTCDKDKRQKDINMMKMKAAASYKSKAAYQARDKASEVIAIGYPLIMTDGVSMKKVL